VGSAESGGSRAVRGFLVGGQKWAGRGRGTAGSLGALKAVLFISGPGLHSQSGLQDGAILTACRWERETDFNFSEVPATQ
jgi:hypothetical protein